MGSKELKAMNRRLLHQQLLTKKTSGPRSAVKVAKAACGINSQDFLESLSSFWARAEGFANSDFESEFRPRGGVVRTWTVRGTVHTVAAEDYYLHVFGSGRRRTLLAYDRWAKKLGIPPLGFRTDSLYRPLLDTMKGRKVTTGEIEQFMMDTLAKLGLRSRRRLLRGWSNKPTYGPSWTGIHEMAYLGLLVSAGRRGAESLWMGASDWLGSRRKVPDPKDCPLALVTKYIQRYGPVTRSDIAKWNDRLFSGEIDEIIESLGTDLVQSHPTGSKETFYAFDDGSDFPNPPAAVILPEFDSMMMAYSDRSRFLSPHNLKQVSRPQGIISRTVLLDGMVSATWGRKKQGVTTKIVVAPFRPLEQRERRSVEEKFSEYGDYLGTGVSVDFQSPLSGK